MARVHVAKIVEEFGDRRLDSVRPSELRSWTAKLSAAGFADSYVHACYRRFAQVLADAVEDGILARSPVSRRTSPAAGTARLYVATPDQIWSLHDAIDSRYRAGVLLGSFAGLRLAEVCGLRVTDVDFMRGIITPAVQYPEEALKTECSSTPVPIPQSLALSLSAHVAEFSTIWIMCDAWGAQMGPWQLQRAFRAARDKITSLPDGFRFHDLRHFYASALIAAGLDVKVVQSRLRHRSAKTTLDTYGHLFPDSDESTRAAINGLMAARREPDADNLRTTTGGDA